MSLEYSLIISDKGTPVLKKIGEHADHTKKKLDEADKKASLFSKSISKLNDAFTGALAIGIAKGISAIKDLTKEMLHNYDSASKLAENIGGTSESIIGLRYAADQSGVGAEAMDKNLAKLSQTISKAGAGNKAAADTFAKMGIEVKKSDGTLKNSTEVMLEMADSFKNLPAGAERATLAMDVFGKSGASMVTVLKDGSDGLREMMDEGSAAAGNIDDISKAMTAFNTVTTRAKAAAMGMMAVIADTSIFKDAIDFLDDLTKAWAKFGIERKNAADTEKVIAQQNKAGAEVDIRMLEKQITDLNIYNEHLKGTEKEKEAMVKALEKQIKLKAEENKLSEEEIELEKQKGIILALNKKSEFSELSNLQKHTLDSAKIKRDEIIASQESARLAAEKAEEEKKAAAAAIAGYEEQQKKEEELAAKRKKAAEEMARDFKAAIKSKEDAIKSLADLDEKTNIRFLDGEAKKTAELNANYKKQMADIDALQQKELFNVKEGSDAYFAILATHAERKKAMEQLHQQDIQNIKDEFAEKDAKAREAAIKSIADIDEKNKLRYLEGEDKKQAELKSSYEKQKADVAAMHEQELVGLEEHSLAKLEIEAAQKDRMKELDRIYQEDSDAIKKEFHEKELKRLEEERDRKFAASAATMQAMQQAFEGQKEFAGLYKTAAIAEATINAAQSVLKTMSGTPYPFNIPLATMQAVAAAAQVNKIRSAKMYAGGMIKGGKRLIQVNEEGNEAILNTGAVRAVGGPEGVNALNSGNSYNTNNYDNSNSQSVNVVINATDISQIAWREKIEQVSRWREKRR